MTHAGEVHGHTAAHRTARFGNAGPGVASPALQGEEDERTESE